MLSLAMEISVQVAEIQADDLGLAAAGVGGACAFVARLPDEGKEAMIHG